VNSRILIYTGILLLLSGLVLTLQTDQNTLSWILILAGAVCKIAYLVIKVANRTYRGGPELGLLVLGLALFFLGKYANMGFVVYWAEWFIIAGIMLKSAFVILFIRRIRQQPNTGDDGADK